ncbi:hypothetical protein SLEP1_g10101 [Rubroshorea leprosula]|uniref:Uncharacterized protein n=1 Tax=Rubroshorea leprosula TaxID=152421 RepID=A0AAV5IGZ0_9ROSI|nr:hypothetical protein SLEP1_g10101 [Rubroshorea leprosula]
MASFHDAQGFRGNQGEEEDVDVISVEPIAMIVPPELQDLPRTAAPESNASSSVSGGSEGHQPSTSSDSPTEETPSGAEGVEEVGCSAPVTSAIAEVVVFEGWESKVLSGWLDNLRKAPKTLPAGFKFRAMLHHEVADGAATVKGYKKLEEMYELALTQLTPNSIKFIIGFMLLCKRLRMPAKAVVFRSLFLCPLCPSTSGMRWYYISRREKMMIFTNIRNKVARWKRQFVFVRDTRIERINNELATRLSEWRTPNTYMNYPQLTIGDVDLKNRLLDYVKARGLVDLETLVTPEQIALHGFVDVANLHSQASLRDNVSELKAQGAGELVPAREVAEAASVSSSVGGPRIAYPDGFSYARTECQTAMLQGMQNFVPPADRLRAKGHVQQHERHAALIKLMDAFSYIVALFECEQRARAQNNELQQSCKQLASEKASLADKVSRLQSSEMANRAASAESRADELARKVNELKEELVRARVEKESGIQAAKEKAESDREKTLHELSSLRERVVQADQHVAQAEASLERTKRAHQRDVCFARAQGAEWLVGAEMF